MPDKKKENKIINAKYCPRVAAASRTHKKHPETRATLTFDLEIQ